MKGKNTVHPKRPTGYRRSRVDDGETRMRWGVMRVFETNTAAVLELQLGLLEAIHEHGRATVDTGEGAEKLRAKFGHLGLRGASVAALPGVIARLKDQLNALGGKGAK